MLTADVIKYAKEDGLTYTSSFGDYSSKDGFEFNDYGKKCLRSDPDKFVKMLFTDSTIWSVKPETKLLSRDELLKEILDKIPVDKLKELLGFDFQIAPQKGYYGSFKELYDAILGDER